MSGGPSWPNPLSSPHWCPWDLFRSLKVCSDAKERVGCGKQREATAPIKSLLKLQPWFLNLRWKTWFRQNCSLGFSTCSEGPAFGQNTLIMNIHYYEMFYLLEHEINESVWKTVNEEKKSIAKREITNLLWERWRTKRLLIFRWPVPQRIPLQPG